MCVLRDEIAIHFLYKISFYVELIFMVQDYFIFAHGTNVIFIRVVLTFARFPLSLQHAAFISFRY